MIDHLIDALFLLCFLIVTLGTPLCIIGYCVERMRKPAHRSAMRDWRGANTEARR